MAKLTPTAVLVERIPLLRQALAHLLSSDVGVSLVSVGANVDAVLPTLNEGGVDLAIFDRAALDDAIAKVIANGDGRPHAPACALIADEFSDTILRRALNAGFACCLLKSDTPDEIASNLRRLLIGEAACSQRLAGQIERVRCDNQMIMCAGAALRRREMQAFTYLASGLTLKGAAREMELSPKTVQSYVTSLMSKLNVKNRAELVRMAIREGLVSARV